MAWLNEIRSSNNAVLRRDSGFATQDAAKIGGRKENEKLPPSSQSQRLRRTGASSGQTGCWAHHGGTGRRKAHAVLKQVYPTPDVVGIVATGLGLRWVLWGLSTTATAEAASLAALSRAAYYTAKAALISLAADMQANWVAMGTSCPGGLGGWGSSGGGTQ
jgi:hypothetical protein